MSKPKTVNELLNSFDWIACVSYKDRQLWQDGFGDYEVSLKPSNLGQIYAGDRICVTTNEAEAIAALLDDKVGEEVSVGKLESFKEWSFWREAFHANLINKFELNHKRDEVRARMGLPKWDR